MGSASPLLRSTSCRASLGSALVVGLGALLAAASPARAAGHGGADAGSSAPEQDARDAGPQVVQAQPPASTPEIAPPAPGATEPNVAKAQQVAQVAAKTPIVPNPHDATHPAFQLYAELDLPVLGIGLVFAGARLVRAQPAYCAPLCNPADVNVIDRVTAGRYVPAWATVSDYGVYGLMAVTATLLVADEGPLDALNDAVVISESALSAIAINSIMTLAAGRPRPFLFGTTAPLSEREGSDAALSFLSSHTAVSSAITASTFMAMKRLHPQSPLPYIVLAVGEGATAFIATARVLSGMHFISDVSGGFVVGTSVGVLVPALHDSPVKVVPVVSDTQRGFNVIATF